MDYLEAINTLTEVTCKDLKEIQTFLTEDWYTSIEKLIRTHNEVLQSIREKQKNLEQEKSKILEEIITYDTMLAEGSKEIREEKMIVEKLESDLFVLKKEVEKQYKELESIKKKSEPSTRDKDYLEKAKTKLSIFKELKLSFDFSVPEMQYIQGNIVDDNSETKYFRYEGNEKLEIVSEKLWEELTLSLQKGK